VAREAGSAVALIFDPIDLLDLTDPTDLIDQTDLIDPLDPDSLARTP
jgi:hypothetical protein